MKISEILTVSPVVPVIEIADAEAAAPLARALRAGGVKIAEFTLRTPAALEAIRLMKSAEPSLVVGAGTILNPDHARLAQEAGADFLVSPGLSERLLEYAAASAVPFLPGVATVSEAMRALDKGLAHLKFFPAEQAGGAAYLRALAGPLPEAVFCPTGGIGPDRVGAYLALPNVACVGGSWVATKSAIEQGDWAQIETNARLAMANRAPRA